VPGRGLLTYLARYRKSMWPHWYYGNRAGVLRPHLSGCSQAGSSSSSILRAAFSGGVHMSWYSCVTACLCAIVECGIARHDLSFATSLIDELIGDGSYNSNATDLLRRLRSSFSDSSCPGVRPLYSDITDPFGELVRNDVPCCQQHSASRIVLTGPNALCHIDIGRHEWDVCDAGSCPQDIMDMFKTAIMRYGRADPSRFCVESMSPFCEMEGVGSFVWARVTLVLIFCVFWE
jgi:hypothetical protein